MPILRKQKVREYTTVDNYFIEDINLSLKGVSALPFICHKPVNPGLTFTISL